MGTRRPVPLARSIARYPGDRLAERGLGRPGDLSVVRDRSRGDSPLLSGLVLQRSGRARQL